MITLEQSVHLNILLASSPVSLDTQMYNHLTHRQEFLTLANEADVQSYSTLRGLSL